MAKFPKSARLRRTPEFRLGFDQGKKSVLGPLVVYAYCAPCEYPSRELRLGLVVSRKVGPAVVRNRVKRALREAFRHFRAGLPPDSPWRCVDLVVLARPSARTSSNQDLGRTLREALHRLRGLLVPSSGSEGRA